MRRGLLIILAGVGLFLFLFSVENSDFSVLRERTREVFSPLPGGISSGFLPQARVLPSLGNGKVHHLSAPEIVRAVYLSGWSAQDKTKFDYILNFAANTSINAAAVDIKNELGSVLPQETSRAVADTLHGRGIYAIARVVVFQDSALAEEHPEWAVQSKSKNTIWRDSKGLAWIDPAARDAWPYYVNIAEQAYRQGFDEINFDYIRFPSDGNLKDMSFPAWDKKTPRREVLRQFFAYLRKELADIPLSADLFGYTTTNYDDLGIGQVMEDAFPYFDFIAPMVYPSHYNPGFYGFKNPAVYPYEVVKISLDSARKRGPNVTFRPWLQDFDLGADYDASQIKAQIQALKDALGKDYAGFMLWNASNIYTAGAFLSP